MAKKIDLKKKFTDITSDIADEFYPKGDPRRGEFIRDQAIIYTKFIDEVNKAIAKQGTINYSLKAVLFAEEITTHFEEVKGGMFSDIAYYELLEMCETFLKGFNGKEFVQYLEFVFGFDGQKEFNTVMQKYQKNLKYWEGMLHGVPEQKKKVKK